MDESYDVVVAGGGPVGAFLALALRDSPISVLHVDSGEPMGQRPIALSHGSRLLLECCHVFNRILSTPIRAIHVSQRAAFGRALINADEYGLPALGYVADYDAIRAAMAGPLPGSPRIGRVTAWSAAPGGLVVRVDGAHAQAQEVHARLLVLADGSNTSTSRDHSISAESLVVRDYNQSALVTQVLAETPHHNIAYERFTPEGPLALLPNRDGHALVWCIGRESAPELLDMSEKNFLARLGIAFGGRLGKFVQGGERHAFPLALRYLKQSPGPRVVAIGNAAQMLHPVAGQGLNLGLRDAWELAAALLDPGTSLAKPEFASDFIRRRRADQRVEIGLTDALVRVFSSPSLLLSAARGAALLAVDTLPPARRLLARTMMYGLRAMP